MLLQQKKKKKRKKKKESYTPFSDPVLNNKSAKAI